MSTEFERIVAELTRGGQLWPAEREIIMRAADRLGLDRATATEILEARLREVGSAAGGSPSDDVGRDRRQDAFDDDAVDGDGADNEEYEIVTMPRMDDGMSSMFKIAGLLVGTSIVMMVLAKAFKS